MPPLFFFWITVALLFLLVEIGNPGLFFFIAFSFGAFCASVVSYYYATAYTVQALVFLGSSIAIFALMRSLGRTYRPGQVATNVWALQGKKGVVVAEIESHKKGQVKIGGEVWAAATSDGAALAVDTQIIVQVVKGAHLIVKEYDTN